VTITAMRIDASDNVACLLRDHAAGERPVLAEGPGPALIRDVPLGHKIALSRIRQGDEVIKYGSAIGWAKQAIEVGEHVHLHNLAGTM